MHATSARLIILAGLCAGAVVVAGVLAGRSSPPSATAASGASATIEVVAPAAPQPLNVPFTVTDTLTSFVPDPYVMTWAGWELELAYDNSILAVDRVVPGGICPSNTWANPATVPVITTGCAFQASTSTGAMDIITFRCIADGTSPLTLVPPGMDGYGFGTNMFDRQGVLIPTTLVNTSVTCDSAATVTPTSTPTPTYTQTGSQMTQTAAASATAAATTPVPTATGVGDATIAVSAPSAPQLLNIPFTVTDNLTSFVPGTSTTWAGWELKLAYDENILAVDGVVKGDLCTPGAWFNPNTPPLDPPSVSTACLVQVSTSTGVMDIISFRCIAPGSSPLALLTEPYNTYTVLFDYQTTPFSMTLVSTSVTCTDATPTPTFTATATATPVVEPVAMIKSSDGTNVPQASGELINLWLCKQASCTGPGEGSLDVYEWIVNVGGDPDGVGAFEFQVKYDNHIFDISIEATNWLYETGRTPGAPGIGGCAATILTENDIRFGCVSKNPVDGNGDPIITIGNMADGVAAIIHITPKADLANRTTPGNNNGAIRTILDEGCEIADIWGHPLSTGELDPLGREILVPGVLPGGLIADCADITITVRILEGDMNLDCTVDVVDDQIEASHYGAFFGNLLYQPWYDLEPGLMDGDVDIKDLQKVFGRNGSDCQAPIPAQDPQPDPDP